MTLRRGGHRLSTLGGILALAAACLLLVRKIEQKEETVLFEWTLDQSVPVKNPEVDIGGTMLRAGAPRPVIHTEDVEQSNFSGNGVFWGHVESKRRAQRRPVLATTHRGLLAAFDREAAVAAKTVQNHVDAAHVSRRDVKTIKLPSHPARKVVSAETGPQYSLRTKEVLDMRAKQASHDKHAMHTVMPVILAHSRVFSSKEGVIHSGANHHALHVATKPRAMDMGNPRTPSTAGASDMTANMVEEAYRKASIVAKQEQLKMSGVSATKGSSGADMAALIHTSRSLTRLSSVLEAPSFKASRKSFHIIAHELALVAKSLATREREAASRLS